jgi:hypothetical protein
MNAARDILTRVQAAGLSLSADGGSLRLTGEHRGALSDELRALIQGHKPELLALLSANDNAESPPGDMRSCWRDCIRSAPLRTEKGERVRRAALVFLGSDSVLEAIEHGWDELQLFGVMSTSDEALLDRRADLKGIVPFVALTVWHGTRVESFTGSHAVIVTGSGAILKQTKRNMDPATVLPFWESEALCPAHY